MTASVQGCYSAYQPLPQQPQVAGGGAAYAAQYYVAPQPLQYVAQQPLQYVVQQPQYVVQQPVAQAAPTTVEGGGPVTDQMVDGCCTSVDQTAVVDPPVSGCCSGSGCPTCTPGAKPVNPPVTPPSGEPPVDPNTGTPVTPPGTSTPPTGVTPPTPALPPTPEPPVAEKPTDPAAGAWNEAWNSLFKSLGATDEQITQIKDKKLTSDQLAVVAQEISRNPGALKDVNGIPTTPGVTPPGNVAMALPTWAKWQEAFTQLGLSPEQITKIGNTALTDKQLAQVYMNIRTKLETLLTQKPGAGTGGWSDAWAKKFSDLGLPPETVAEIAKVAQANSLDDAAIEEIYNKAVEQMGGQPGSGQPGWNAEWQAKFEKLGMPKAMIKVYAESGASAEGIAKAYESVKERRTEFKKGGWFDKFKAAGMPKEEIWALVLAPGKKTNKQLKDILSEYKADHRSGLKKALGHGAALIPGVQLLDYLQSFATHKSFRTGKKRSQGDIVQIGGAVLSGIALLGAVRGIKGIRTGLAARNSILAGTAALSGAKLGEELLKAPAWKAYIPFTKTSANMIALGQAERTASQFYQGGGKELLEAAGRVKEAGILDNLYQGVRDGSVQLQGDRNWILPLRGPFQTNKAKFGASFVAGRAAAGETAATPGLLKVKASLAGWRTNNDAALANFANAAGQHAAAVDPRFAGSLGELAKLNVGRDVAGRVGTVLQFGKKNLLSTILPSHGDAARHAATYIGTNPGHSAYLDTILGSVVSGNAARTAATTSLTGHPLTQHLETLIELGGYPGTARDIALDMARKNPEMFLQSMGESGFNALATRVFDAGDPTAIARLQEAAGSINQLIASVA